MAFVPAVLVAAGIAVLSLWEQPVAPVKIALNDKLVHGVMYAVLAASLMGAFVYIRRAKWTVYLAVGMCATAYGALMEILQRYCTLYRSAEMADLYADAIGAVIGLIIIGLWHMCMTSH
jgi:VanZ family protein